MSRLLRLFLFVTVIVFKNDANYSKPSQRFSCASSDGPLLGINRVLAVYRGPAGYGVLGQFQNAVQMIITFACGAINTKVTKYTAENNQNEVQ